MDKRISINSNQVFWNSNRIGKLEEVSAGKFTATRDGREIYGPASAERAATALADYSTLPARS